MHSMLKQLTRFTDRLSGFGGLLAGIMMCLGVGLIVCEIILRSMFSKTLYVTEEYAGYLMAMLTFCALGFTLRERGHIRMTFLFRALSGKSRAVLDLICCLVGFAFCVVLTYYTAIFFWDSVVSGSRSMQISQTYLAIPQAFLPFGAMVFTLQFLGEFLKNILVLRGDTGGIHLGEDAGDLGR